MTVGTPTGGPSRLLATVIALGLLAAGAGTWLIGSSAPSRQPRPSGPVAPANPSARDPLDIRAHNSPSVARNPERTDNLVVTSRVDSPMFACAVYVSDDGAGRWSESKLPAPAGEEPKCFAPDAAFGSDGTLYVSFVTLAGTGNVPHAGWVVSSTDGGRTFSVPVRALGPQSFQVRLVADSENPRRLWLSWLEVGEVGLLAFSKPGNPVNVARSDDGGATWGEPVRVSPPGRQRVVAPSPALGRNGRLHVAYLDVGDDSLDYHGGHQGRGGEPYPGNWQLLVATSADGGATWTEAAADKTLVPTERFLAFLPPFPSVAADRTSDRVYVSFADGRSGDADVWLWGSVDSGATWARPHRVNDTRPGDGTSQYLSRISVSPGGRVDVVYYDRRADSANVLNEVSFQSSFDRGATFSRRAQLSGAAFDSRVGFGSERGMPDLGSRLALISSDTGALAVWSDTRAGTEASSKQDLAVAQVAVGGDDWRDRLRWPLRAAAAALVLAALVVVAGALRRRGPLVTAG
ncbi:MAG: sialidase family protein [Acidimicrobiales bacterium]